MSRTAKLASINPTPAPEGQGCPVAALAAEAAQIVRALYALAPPDSPLCEASAKVPALANLFEGDSGPTLEVVQSNLRKRLYGVAKFAQFRDAKSIKGALFHLYLAGNEAICIDGEIFDAGENLRKLKGIGERLENLLYSAIGMFDDGQDDDLRVLRSWFYPTEDHEASHGATVLKELDTLGQPRQRA
jgi:hypothetical protein